MPAFTGSTTVAVPIACNYDLEVTAAKYLHSLPDGEAPLALHFNGMIYYPGEDGGLQMVLVPWTRSVDFRMPVAVWRETIEHYYPNTGWVGLRSETLAGAATSQGRPRPRDLRRLRRRAAGRRRVVTDALEQLVDSLLYEGYALYPYTPGSREELDPDPVRDRLSARLRGDAHEHLRPSRAALRARGVRPTPCSSAEVRFLAADGERHQAQARQVTLARRDGRSARP